MKNTFLAILIISSLQSLSKTIFSTNSGNWNTTQTWNTLTIPTEFDTVIITNQDTININTSSAKCNHLEIDGTIFFKSGTNTLTTNSILCKNQSEINGTSLGSLTTDELINNGMFSIGRIKLTVNEQFVNNFKLTFSSKSGFKNFGALVNNGTIDNPFNETLSLKNSLDNLGLLNWNTGTINFTDNATIQSKNLLYLESITFNDTLVNKDSLKIKSINGTTLINKGYLDFISKDSDISINHLTMITPNTLAFSYGGSISLPNFTISNFDNLILNCDRFLVYQQFQGNGKLTVSNQTTLVNKTENNFPLFNEYNFHPISKVIIEENTVLPKNIQFSNLEIKSGYTLNLQNTDSLFISGDLMGAGILQNHNNIIYNGTKKQTIKRMDYNNLIYNNSGIDTSLIVGANTIDSLIITNGNFAIGGLTISNSKINKNGVLIINGANPTFKNNLIIEGTVTLNNDQSSPLFNNIIILPSGLFKNNASSDPIINGNILNNGTFIGCTGTSCNYNFTSNNTHLSGKDTIFISKLKAKKLTNSGLLVVSQSLKVDSMIADSNAQLWLGMDSIHISGSFDFLSNLNSVYFNKTGNQNISKGMNSFSHIIIENEGNKTIHNHTFIKDQLDIKEKSTFKTDSFKTSLPASAKLNIEEAGILILGHNYNTQPILFPSLLIRNNINLHDSSIVSYAGKQDQIISCVPKYGHLTIDDGAVDSSFISLNNDTLFVNGNLTLEESSLHFQILDNIIKVKGDWNGPGNCKLTSGEFQLGGNGNSSGKISPGTSTFLYNGQSKQRFKISKYHNVVIDKNGEAYTKANLGVLQIDSLLVKNGIMNFKGEESYVDVLTIEDSVIFQSKFQEKVFNKINIAPTGIFELDYNETVTIKGDINCDGIFSIKKGSLLFNDTLLQNITGTGQIRLGKTTINKPQNHIQVYTNLKLNDTLQMDSGNIILNDAHLTLAANAFIKNENKNAYFSGDNKGTITTSKVVLANQSTNFSGIGILINNTFPMGNTMITRKFNAINIAGNPSTFKNFDIDPTFNSSLNANLEMNFFNAELNKIDSNNLALWKTEDNINWIKMDGIVSQNKISLAHIGSFSKWTINAQKMSLLSVELISHSVKRVEENININWEIAEETNTIGYLIEVSSDGINFHTETTVKTNNIKIYSYNLNNISTIITFIRVSEITPNSATVLFTEPVRPYYSTKPIIHVNNNKIIIKNFVDGVIKVYSSNGQLIERKAAQTGLQTIFPKGIYFVILENEIETQTFKIGIL